MNDSQLERNWAMGCHLAALAFYVGIPFGNILGPLIIWLLKRNEFELVNEQGKEALNFQISFIIYGIAGIVLAIIFAFAQLLASAAYFVIGIFIFLLFLLDLVLIIVAAVKVANGESYKYPLTIHFLK